MQHIGFIALLLVFVIIAVYAYVQMKPSESKFFDFFSSLRFTPATSTTTAGKNVSQPAKQTVSRPQPNTKYYSSTSPQPNINPSEIPAGFSANQLSPYFKRINISASPASGYIGSYSRIYLYAYLNQNEKVDVTGWLLKGNRGSMYIPQAVDVYDPSGLTPDSDIYLKSGESLNIYSTASAISRNFHLNKCIGYLSNANTFTPSLPLNCPYVNRSDISGFTGPCQSYILSIGSCQLPKANPPIPETDYGCRQFIDNTLNYSGCFNKYRSDSDFLSREWWVWTGNSFLDSQHDRLLLFDLNGLLVAEYSY